MLRPGDSRTVRRRRGVAGKFVVVGAQCMFRLLGRRHEHVATSARRSQLSKVEESARTSALGQKQRTGQSIDHINRILPNGAFLAQRS
jgi:hypothetical protein